MDDLGGREHDVGGLPRALAHGTANGSGEPRGAQRGEPAGERIRVLLHQGPSGRENQDLPARTTKHLGGHERRDDGLAEPRRQDHEQVLF